MICVSYYDDNDMWLVYIMFMISIINSVIIVSASESPSPSPGVRGLGSGAPSGENAENADRGSNKADAGSRRRSRHKARAEGSNS